MPRIYGKTEIYNLLDQKGISYDKLEHAAVFTMEEMDAAHITDKGNVCKNLFLRDYKGNNHFLVTAPENKRVDLRALAETLESSKLSFGSPERLDKYLGVTQGSVSPLCILNDENAEVTVIFDEDLKSETAIGVHPCDNTATIWLSFTDLLKIIEDHGNKVEFAHFEKYE